MSQGNDFANYDSSADDRGSASEDVWFVAVSSDDIKQMSVDQLDEAFRLGLISAQTAVWTEGMEAWAPLGEVADLDSDESSSEASEPASEPAFASVFSAPAPVVAPPQLPHAHLHQQQSHQQQSHEQPFHQQPSHQQPSHEQPFNEQPSHQQNWHNPFDAPAASASSASAHEHSVSQSHLSMGPSSFAPVTASYAPSSPGLAHSTGPVALNVDEDMPPVNRGRSWRPERWLLAAAGVAALGVIAFNNSDLFSSGASVAAAEKTSAAALAPRPYEAPPERGSTVLAAAKLDDGKDAPIGSLVPAAGARDDDDDTEKAAEPAAVAPSALNPKLAPSSKTAASSKDSVRGGMSKAFSGKKTAAAKPAKATKARKPPSRAAASKSKKSGVARTSSAFDPLNGSLP